MTGLNKQDWITIISAAIAAALGGGGVASYKIANTDFRPNAYTSITAAQERAEDKEWVRNHVERELAKERKQTDAEMGAALTLINGCITNTTKHEIEAGQWKQRIMEVEKDVRQLQTDNHRGR